MSLIVSRPAGLLKSLVGSLAGSMASLVGSLARSLKSLVGSDTTSLASPEEQHSVASHVVCATRIHGKIHTKRGTGKISATKEDLTFSEY